MIGARLLEASERHDSSDLRLLPHLLLNSYIWWSLTRACLQEAITGSAICLVQYCFGYFDFIFTVNGVKPFG